MWVPAREGRARKLHIDSCVVLAFLCLFVVGALFTSCRRQRQHSETVESEERQELRSALELNSEDLSEAWIATNQPVHVLSGQLLLTVTTTEVATDRSTYHASLRVVLPDGQIEEWTDLAVGTRKTLKLGDTEYMVDVTGVMARAAQVSIIRRR